MRDECGPERLVLLKPTLMSLDDYELNIDCNKHIDRWHKLQSGPHQNDNRDKGRETRKKSGKTRLVRHYDDLVTRLDW